MSSKVSLQGLLSSFLNERRRFFRQDVLIMRSSTIVNKCLYPHRQGHEDFSSDVRITSILVQTLLRHWHISCVCYHQILAFKIPIKRQQAGVRERERHGERKSEGKEVRLTSWQIENFSFSHFMMSRAHTERSHWISILPFREGINSRPVVRNERHLSLDINLSTKSFL